MKTFVVLLLSILTLGACSKSSPTEPNNSSSLDGYVRINNATGPANVTGTITVKDSSGQSTATAIESTTGNFTFGSVFVPGAYDIYLDYPGKAQQHFYVTGADALKPGINHYFIAPLCLFC